MVILKDSFDIALIITGLVGAGFIIVVCFFQLMAMTSPKYKDVNDD